MLNQALGLAEALGAAITVKTFKARSPWSWLPPRFWPAPLRAGGDDSDSLDTPWPDVVISCGKRAAAPCAAIKRASGARARGGRTLAVHIQTPPIDFNKFDLLVVPAHDGTSGPNVLTTDAAVHRVTAAKLADAASRFRDRFAALPRPLVAVLIGGSNNRHRLTPAIAADVGAKLAGLVRDKGAGLIVTPSRRTGAENEAILRTALAGLPAEVWDGSGENPYFGMLALADAIVVTEDSVSMASEAISTGKPVYVIGLEGHSGRIARFHERMRAGGYTRPFDGGLDTWQSTPPDDTARAAAEIRRLLALQR
jgi:mitochondrial fission protein ELM1